ncbi:MAG: hypothetical protein ABI171_14820 [Collimonas sp.]|uniref:hypothetical protein n=1 Tax=Collimonas sp. TaxID=1963772 RepID=UPI003267D056
MTNSIITSSTELMRNYKQAEIMAPDASFAALQTTAGNALLFSIGTDGVCYLTQETTDAKVGWQRSAFSAGLGAGGVKSIAVAQNRDSGEIDIALVMAGTPNDSLYLSLGNSAADLGWTANPAWAAMPFDATASHTGPITINNVFISEASDGEYIVADILRDQADPVPLISRYYIDPTRKLTGQAWNAHDVAGDIEAASARSALGRRSGDLVDGIYTLGRVVNHGQLMYQPLYNPFRPNIAVNPVALAVPGGAIGTALCAVAATGNATDLYVAYGQTIYCYPADAQQQGGVGITLLDYPVLQGIQSLFGAASATRVILWGLNQADQIFYTSCPLDSLRNPAAWSVPLPIFTGVEQVSPYLNRSNDGNCFFVHSGMNDLRRATQAPDTTTWKAEKILLPAPPAMISHKGTSYTTRLQLTSADKQPLPGAVVQLSAQRRAGVYINGLYYVLDATPIPVPADAIGSINIIEWIDDLTGTPLKVVGPDGQTLAINPMDKAFQKAASLNTTDALSSATIPDPQGGAGRPLVAPGTSDADLAAAAGAFDQLGKVYQTLPADGSVALNSALRRQNGGIRIAHLVSVSAGAGHAPHPQMLVGGFLDSIEVAAGDLLSWLEDAADYVVHIVQDAATDLWHFMAQIAGEVYSFVLDAAEKVVGAIVAIYNAIKTAIEDLIAFLEFLFEWKSFVRTKDVCQKFVLMSLERAVQRIDTLKVDFNSVLEGARSKVDDWAETKSDGWQSGVANGSQPLGFMGAVADIENILTAPAMFLYHHFADNVGGAQGSDPGAGSTGSAIVDRVIQALDNEGDILVGALGQIKSTLIDGSSFSNMSLEDTLKTLVAIVVDALLNSTEDLVDAMMDLLAAVIQAAIDDLSTPVWIPVVSDILEDFGVTVDFSLLDVIMMVAAIPATLGYKIAHGSAPFEAGDISDQILAASTPAELTAALNTARGSGKLTLVSPAALGRTETTGGGMPLAIYVAGNVVAGLGSIVNAVLSPGLLMDEEEGASWQRAATAAALVTVVADGIAGFVDGPDPIVNSEVAILGQSVTALTIVGKVVSPLIARKVFGDQVTTDQEAKIGAGLDAVLALIALTPAVYHFQELSGDPAGAPRSAAIVTETASIVSSLGSITGFFAVIDDDPESKAALSVGVGVLALLYGGLKFGAAAINPESDQASVPLVRAIA